MSEYHPDVNVFELVWNQIKRARDDRKNGRSLLVTGIAENGKQFIFFRLFDNDIRGREVLAKAIRICRKKGTFRRFVSVKVRRVDLRIYNPESKL